MFAPQQSDVLDSVQKEQLEGLVLNQIRQWHSNSDVGRFQIEAYGDSLNSGIANARARFIADILTSKLGNTVIFESKAAPSGSGHQPWGAVTIRPEIRLIAFSENEALRGVRFSTGKWDLDGGNLYLLDAAAAYLLARPEYQRSAMIEVVGHPDTRNDRHLAERRAASLKDGLVERGIDPARIVTRVADTPVEATPVNSPARPVQHDLMTIPGESVVSTPLLTSGSSSGASTPFSLSWEAVAQAATEAIVEAAEKQMQDYVMVTFSHRICDYGQALLDATCAVLRNSGRERYAPSLSTIRMLVRQDVERFPDRAIGMLLERYPASVPMAVAVRGRRLLEAIARVDQDRRGAASDAARDTLRFRLDSLRNELRSLGAGVAEYIEHEREIPHLAAKATIALYAFDFGRRMQRGEDPLEVLGRFPEWMSAFNGRFPNLGYVDSAPEVQSMRQFSSFVAATRAAADELQAVTAGITPQDSVLRYAALTLVANRQTAATTGWESRLAPLLDARRQVEVILPALDSIRRRILNLQSYGISTLDQRRELYTSALVHLTNLALIGFSSTQDATVRERIGEFRETLSGLVAAARTQSYPQVLQQSLSIVRELAPPDTRGCISVRTCSPAFAQQQLRVLTLAVDVSEADTEQELRSAMSRFVGSSGGLAAKRTAPVQSSLHLNSYVGAGWAAREGAAPGVVLRLPIGVELVPEWPRIRRQFMISFYAQVLDLGGFLPQPDDSVERSTDQRLASVFAPGLFAMTALGDMPASIGLGVTSSSHVAGEEWKVSPRLVVFFGIDVPLMKLR